MFGVGSTEFLNLLIAPAIIIAAVFVFLTPFFIYKTMNVSIQIRKRLSELIGIMEKQNRILIKMESRTNEQKRRTA